jgi:hypothetical protein
MTSDRQTKSQAAQQNSDHDEAQGNLTDSDVEELVRFFQLLDEWDREAQSVAKRENAIVHSGNGIISV